MPKISSKVQYLDLRYDRSFITVLCLLWICCLFLILIFPWTFFPDSRAGTTRIKTKMTMISAVTTSSFCVLQTTSSFYLRFESSSRLVLSGGCGMSRLVCERFIEGLSLGLIQVLVLHRMCASCVAASGRNRKAT